MGEELPMLNSPLTNRLSMDVFDLTANADISLDYERVMNAKGKLALLISASYSINKNRRIEYDFQKLYDVGAGLMYYPVGHWKWKYFTGVRLIVGKSAYSNYFSVRNSNDYTYLYVNENYLYGKAYIDNGLLLSQQGAYYFSAVVSFGTSYLFHVMIAGIERSVTLSLNVGLRF